LIGELQNCFRIHLSELYQDYTNYIENKEILRLEEFDFDALIKTDTLLSYKGVQATNIVFSEGWRSVFNPFFEGVDFTPSKGELLIVKIPDLDLKKAYKKKIFITPLHDDIYWVGATSEWDNLDPSKTESKRTFLVNELQSIVQLPFTIESHLSGMRPSTKDRRPILGTCKSDARIHIFNGMGTKGSSLAPYFSEVFLSYLLDNVKLDDVVDVNRFYD
jgi:glycine/D-amino acid oxidase-like deaminating enzyme